MSNYPTKNISTLVKNLRKMGSNDYMGFAGASRGSSMVESGGWTYVFSLPTFGSDREVHAVSSTGRREYLGRFRIDEGRIIFSGWTKIL